MKALFFSLSQSFKILKEDKAILFFSFFPLAIGACVYLLLGGYIYGDLLDYLDAWIKSSISAGGWGSFVYYIIVSIMTVAMYFIINWTFVLLVSLLASPFNDIISQRVAKVILHEKPESLSESFKDLVKNFAKVILNETKKILFILSISLLVFSLNFFPLLAPISFILSALLLAANFLDYSWSRDELTLKECLSSLRGQFFPYAVAGSLFIFLMAIPGLNLFSLPFGVIYFTILFEKKKL